MKLRQYQIDISEEGTDIVKKLGIVVLAMEVRLGKTLTAFAIADKLKVGRALMVTKKKPILSGTLRNDFHAFERSWELDLINFESIHKIERTDYDLIIVDEFHSLGAFPKPSARTKRLREFFGKVKPKYHIMLSGTPSPESYSQLFHPFWINERYSPWEENSFYKWAKAGFVNITQKRVAHGNMVNDYSDACIKLIKQKTDKYFISFTQEEAGFKTQVKDKLHFVPMQDRTYKMIEKLKRDRLIEGKQGGYIIADTPVQLMQKMHQLYSGTVIATNAMDQQQPLLVDHTKAQYIAETFKGQKMAIFYKYKAELDLLRKNIPHLVTDLGSWHQVQSNNLAIQISSGREGISLKKADVLIMYNIDFSNVSYIQGRDRLTSMDRLENTVHWIFSRGGMEMEIYRTITKHKTKFNKVYFDKWQAADKVWHQMHS